MTFIDSYESQLVEAGRRRRDALLRNRIARRMYVPRRRGPAIVLAALIVAVPTAAATVGNWNPFDDPGRNPRFPAPSASQRSLDPELVATLGVLRRPQTGGDRGLATSTAARAFSKPRFQGVNVKGIRLLDADRGVVLVPFERIPVPTDPAGNPLPGIDPATYTNAVCLFERTTDGFAGIGCHTAAKISAGRAISSSSGTVSGLVPDGVARVRLLRGDAATEAAVHDNYFAADAAQPTQVEWLGPDGAVVKRIDLTAAPPTP
jgi:hypothetical protein